VECFWEKYNCHAMKPILEGTQTSQSQTKTSSPINDINRWHYVIDEHPGVELDAIFPISSRVACFIARNKDKQVLKQHFLNVQGAVEMLKGLDYHHDNFMFIIGELAKIGIFGDAIGLETKLFHETVAYLNRLGQFYYFTRSSFVKERCLTVESLTTSISKHAVFRMKHSAHRSIDAPKGESEHIQMAQALSMSVIGGKMFSPKPGQSHNLAPNMTVAELEEFQKISWKKCYRTFQLITDNPNVFYNFSPEKEHPTIMQEGLSVLKQLVK